MSVADYNTDPNSNTSISGINIAEGCPPSGINNAIRQMMADIKTADNANVKLTGNQNVGGIKNFTSEINETRNTGGGIFRSIFSHITKGTYPGDQENSIIDIMADKDKNRLATIEAILRANGNVVTRLYAFHNDANLSSSASMEVESFPDGAGAAHAPGTLADNSTHATNNDVITRGFFNDNVVKLSGNQDITGVKTWTVQSTGPRSTNTSQTLTVDMRVSDTPNGGIFDVTNQNWVIGRSGATGGFFIQTKSGSSSATMEGNPDGTLTWNGSNVITAAGGTMTGILVRNGDLARSGNASGSISIYNGSTASDGAGIWLYGKSHGSRPSWIFLQTYTTAYHALVFDGTAFYPAEKSTDLGKNNSTNRWKNEYFQTNPNVSSDERIKSSIGSIPDDVLDAWADVNWSQFQMNDAIEEKGINNARLHTGVVAQRVRDAFSAHDIDATRYGLFCYDEWSEKPEERDEKGEVISEAIPAGNQYSIRYGEALCMEAAYQRRRADRAEARITALERRLDEMEAVLATLGA